MYFSHIFENEIYLNVQYILICDFGARVKSSLFFSSKETLGVDCSVDEKVNSGDKKVITYNGTALSPSCQPMTFRATDQLVLCVQSSLFRDPDCAAELRFTNRKNGEVNLGVTYYNYVIMIQTYIHACVTTYQLRKKNSRINSAISESL